MPVAIVGDRGCGKSVFVSLLTMAADQYAKETGGQRFTWYQDPKYTQRVGELQKQLKQRRWPPATIKGTLSGYYFWFGYRRRLRSALRGSVKKIPKWHPTLDPRGAFNIIKFNLYDIAGEDVELIKQVAEKRTDASFAEALSETENLKTILDCDVLVFLVDSQRITAQVDNKEYTKMLDYDVVMSTLISAVADYKSSQTVGGKLYPVFVFTKFDMIDRSILESVGLPVQYSEWAKSIGKGRTFASLFVNQEMVSRRKNAIKLMGEFYPRTLNLIYGGRLKGVDFSDGQYFFSEIRTELNEDGIPVPRLKALLGGKVHTLDYAYSEYKAFIQYFKGLASGMRKEPTAESVSAG